MVAILVIVTVLAFLLWEHASHREPAPAVAPAIRVAATRFAPPPVDRFLTRNHLEAGLLGNGVLRLTPDSLLRDAAGNDARWITREPGTTLETGDELMRVECGDHSFRVDAPCNGEVVHAIMDTVMFKPRRLDRAMRRMNIGEEISKFMERERERLENFLGESRSLTAVLADGGELRSGFLAHLDKRDAGRFRRTFLMQSRQEL